MDNNHFQELGVLPEIQKAVAQMGYEEPTQIQAQTIPLILSGRDVTGHSQTGSGKTAAFAIPAIQRIDPSSRHTQVLVLCPTRELAVQASDEVRKFAKYMHGIKTVPIYGGQPIDRQINLLKNGAHIVIGTPGRVIDHINRRTLRLRSITMVVLDEADEMLNMGFRDDIEKILEYVPKERQTMLFSATMSREILDITHRYQNDPQLVRVSPAQLTVSSIVQYSYDVPRGRKTEALCRILAADGVKRSIVFCNTKKQVDELAGELKSRAVSAEGLHGDMKQQARNTVMAQFKTGRIEVLVATDVAARGIDVDDVECVFNYDVPQDAEYYVHRIGRTGRAGKDGVAHTFITGRRQVQFFREILHLTRSRVKKREIPSLSDVQQQSNQKLAARVLEILRNEDLTRELALVDELMCEGNTSSEVAAALLLLASGKRRTTDLMPSEYASSSPASGSSMARIRLDIGRNAKIAAKHIVGAIAGESGISGSEIGRIEIFEDFTLADVPAAKAKGIVAAMQSSRVNGRPTNVELA